MATTYCDIYDMLTSDGDLWKKATVAGIIAAINIRNEAPTTPNHTTRLAWANALLADPAGWVKEAKVSILENATVRAAGHKATDNDVQFVVNGLAPVAA